VSRDQLEVVFDVAEKTYEDLAAVKPSEDAPAELQYAALLVEMRFRKVSSALKLADQILRSAPNYAPAHRARLRLLLHARRGNDTLAQADQVLQLAEGKELLPAAQVLGEAVGYLEGPGANLVKPVSLQNLKERITSRLTDKALEEFEQQVRAVLVAYEVVVVKHGQADEDRKLKAKSQIDQLEANQQDIELAKEKNRSQAEMTRAAIANQAQSISARYADLQNSYNRLSAAQAGLNTQLRIALADLADVESRIAYELQRPRNPSPDPRPFPRPDRPDTRPPADPFLLQQLERQRWSLEALVRDLNVRLNVGLEQQRSLIVAGRQLEGQMQQAAGENARANQFFASKEQELSKSKVQLQAAERTLKASLKKGPKLPSLSERSYLRYDTFNFALEKQAVLDGI
jgi:hypothetical protein